MWDDNNWYLICNNNISSNYSWVKTTRAGLRSGPWPDLTLSVSQFFRTITNWRWFSLGVRLERNHCSCNPFHVGWCFWCSPLRSKYTSSWVQSILVVPKYMFLIKLTCFESSMTFIDFLFCYRKRNKKNNILHTATDLLLLRDKTIQALRSRTALNWARKVHLIDLLIASVAGRETGCFRAADVWNMVVLMLLIVYFCVYQECYIIFVELWKGEDFMLNHGWYDIMTIVNR